MIFIQLPNSTKLLMYLPTKWSFYRTLATWQRRVKYHLLTTNYSFTVINVTRNELDFVLVFETLSSMAEKNRAKDQLSSSETHSNLDSRFSSDTIMDKIMNPDDICVPTSTFAVMVTSTLFAFILTTLIGVVIFAKAITRFWADRAGSKQKHVHYQKKTDHYKEVFVPYFNSIYR